jgi:hypothetical protein
MGFEPMKSRIGSTCVFDLFTTAPLVFVPLNLTVGWSPRTLRPDIHPRPLIAGTVWGA